MPEFRYGPVEFYLVGFEGQQPDTATLDALSELLESGLVRLLDFVLLAKGEDGTITEIEVEDDSDALGLGVDLVVSGLASEADIQDFAEQIPEGGSAALVALELVYARTLAASLAASGAVVLRTERIPAPIVNAMIDLAEAEAEAEAEIEIEVETEGV